MSRLRLIAIASLVAAIIALPSSAAADVSTFTDDADDVVGLPYVDLTRVKVTHTSKRIKVTYRSRSAGNMIGTEVLWLDTDRRRRGPELEIGFARFSEGWTTPLRNWKRDKSAAAKRNWATSPLRSGRCDGTVRARYNYENDYTPLTITIKKRKGCVSTKRARIHLRSSTSAYAVNYGPSDIWPETVVDNLPNGSRVFTTWVRQGQTRTFSDDPDPVRWWTDIVTTEAQLTTGSSIVRVGHRPRPPGRDGIARVYFDTDGDAVPNWVVELYDSGTSSRFLSALPDWSTGPGPSTCVVDGELAEVGESISKLAIPADCLGNPTQMRIAVEMRDFAPKNHGASDWLAGERTWSAPVLAGGVITLR